MNSGGCKAHLKTIGHILLQTVVQGEVSGRVGEGLLDQLIGARVPELDHVLVDDPITDLWRRPSKQGPGTGL